MQLAATFGETWVTVGDRTRQGPIGAPEGARLVREQVVRLEDTCGRARRDPAALRRLVLSGALLDAGLTSPEAFRDTTGRYAEAGVTDFVVHWPRANQPYAGDRAAFERTISQR